MQHFKPIVLLLVYTTLLLVGTPGLDFLKRESFSEQQLNRFRDRYGSVLTGIGIGFNEFNIQVRHPIVKRIGSFQTVFRIRQAWHLYRDGSHATRRLNIRVDDQLVYRTNDPDFNWLEPQLRSRRLRPMVEMTTKNFKSANWLGLSRYVVEQARERWPEARRVELLARSGKRPGTKMKTTHRITARAPNWTPEKTR